MSETTNPTVVPMAMDNRSCPMIPEGDPVLVLPDRSAIRPDELDALAAISRRPSAAGVPMLILVDTRVGVPSRELMLEALAVLQEGVARIPVILIADPSADTELGWASGYDAVYQGSDPNALHDLANALLGD